MKENLGSEAFSNIEKAFGGTEDSPKTTLERYRSIPRTIKTLILFGGMALSLHMGKRSLDYHNLKEAQELIDTKLEKFSSIEEKIANLKNLLGEYYLNRMPGYSEYRELEKQKTHLASTQKDFSFFDGVGSIRKEEYLSESILNEDTQDEVSQEVTEQLIVSDLVSSNNKDTLSGTAFGALIEQTYPKGWVLGEVTTISQKDIEETETTNYYGMKNLGAWAYCSNNLGTYKSEVVFCRFSFSASLQGNIAAFSHETGHANDWNMNNNLSFKERIELLTDIVERVQSGDRYHSSEVESINMANQQKELQSKAEEYWAEVCEVYFSGSIQNLNYKDVQIVESIIKNKDPDFNRENAYTVRLDSIYAHSDNSIIQL